MSEPDQKVVSLGDAANNSMMTSPESALKDALNDLKTGERWEGRKKLLVLCLDADKGMFDLGYINAGMKASELVALLECAKQMIFRDMNY